jgi:hypothetical protein
MQWKGTKKMPRVKKIGAMLAHTIQQSSRHSTTSNHEHYVQESESERDAGHRSSGSDHDDGNLNDPTQPIDSVPPAPSEEELSTASTSSDEEFEDLTSEEDDEEADDDDDEFVLHLDNASAVRCPPSTPGEDLEASAAWAERRR